MNRRYRISSLFCLVLATCLFGTGCKLWQNEATTGQLIKPLSRPLADAAVKRKAPASERELCMETAKMVAEHSHAREATLLYEKAEQLAPQEPALNGQLAPLYAQQGEYDKSIQRYQQLIAAGKADASTYNNLAWTLMEAGQFGPAIQQANEGLKLEPDNRRLHSTLAITYYHSGNRDAAFQQFSKAYGLSAAHHNLAILDVEAGNQATAIHHAQQATLTAGNSSESTALLAALQQ